MRCSVVIPARNEEAQLGGTLRAAFAAAESLAARRPDSTAEIVVVDDGSTDRTGAVAAAAGARVVRVAGGPHGAARARNAGVRATSGDVLVFVDADTRIPPEGLVRVAELSADTGRDGGIFRLAASDGGVRARIWWTFWDHVRRLPLPRAKAMPAFMWCTRAVFDGLGPFDESVQIGEEWPILAELYRRRRGRFVYDRTITARSSSRRMELARYGYARTFAKWVWAVVHRSGRLHYADHQREPPAAHGRDEGAA